METQWLGWKQSFRKLKLTHPANAIVSRWLNMEETSQMHKSKVDREYTVCTLSVYDYCGAINLPERVQVNRGDMISTINGLQSPPCLLGQTSPVQQASDGCSSTQLSMWLLLHHVYSNQEQKEGIRDKKGRYPKCFWSIYNILFPFRGVWDNRLNQPFWVFRTVSFSLYLSATLVKDW